MNFETTLELYGGGPGSGRKPGSGVHRAATSYINTLGKSFSSGIHKNVNTIDGEVLTWSGPVHRIDAFVKGHKLGKIGVMSQTKGGRKIWTVQLARVNESLIGKGYGKYLYGALIDQALKNGVDAIHSEAKAWRSKGAEHAWANIRNHVPVNSLGKNRTQRWEISLQ